jgi:hypothetical protein
LLFPLRLLFFILLWYLLLVLRCLAVKTLNPLLHSTPGRQQHRIQRGPCCLPLLLCGGQGRQLSTAAAAVAAAAAATGF